jgi:predicted transcriptional regulator
MAIADRREAAKEMSSNGMSQQQIGAVLDIGQATVSRDLHSYSNGSQSDGEQVDSYPNESESKKKSAH